MGWLIGHDLVLIFYPASQVAAFVAAVLREQGDESDEISYCRLT
ncbi:hypothetical protein [Xenorhabdus cabanillasii]|nr:hypothetical protein [Xenorhabdus cabanillasii]